MDASVLRSMTSPVVDALGNGPSLRVIAGATSLTARLETINFRAAEKVPLYEVKFFAFTTLSTRSCPFTAFHRLSGVFLSTLSTNNWY